MVYHRSEVVFAVSLWTSNTDVMARLHEDISLGEALKLASEDLEASLLLEAPTASLGPRVHTL